MPVRLLDVNVLIALAWSHHEHHAPAHDWFDGLPATDQWATCPLTECGFVRISATPRVIHDVFSPAEASQALDALTSHEGHVFWPDDLRLTEQNHVPTMRLPGHRLVTDAYLLALCIDRGGILGTFDGGVATLARSVGNPDAVELVPR